MNSFRKDLLTLLSQSRRQVLASLSTEVKVAFLMHKIAAFDLTAEMSDSDIEKAVMQHFKATGLEVIPKLNWGKLFRHPVQSRARKRQWTWDMFETVLDGTVQNFILGYNLYTGSQYASGSLTDRIKALQEDGKSDTEIGKLLAYGIGQEASTVERNMTFDRSNFDNSVSPSMKGITPELEPGSKGMVLDSVLNMESLSKSEASKWMSLTQRDPVLRSILKTIDKTIESRGGKDVNFVWQVMKKNPDFKNMRDLGREPVEFVDPDTGETKTEPLYQAIVTLGFTKTLRENNIAYILKKLNVLLQQIRPMALEALYEKEQG